VGPVVAAGVWVGAEVALRVVSAGAAGSRGDRSAAAAAAAGAGAVPSSGTNDLLTGWAVATQGIADMLTGAVDPFAPVAPAAGTYTRSLLSST